MSAILPSESEIIKPVEETILEKNITVPLKGKFKITGIVNSSGLLNVTSLTSITKEYCGCEEQIKSALNAMKNWSPASSSGKSSSAPVEFILIF